MIVAITNEYFQILEQESSLYNIEAKTSNGFKVFSIGCPDLLDRTIFLRGWNSARDNERTDYSRFKGTKTDIVKALQEICNRLEVPLKIVGDSQRRVEM